MFALSCILHFINYVSACIKMLSTVGQAQEEEEVLEVEEGVGLGKRY